MAVSVATTGVADLPVGGAVRVTNGEPLGPGNSPAEDRRSTRATPSGAVVAGRGSAVHGPGISAVNFRPCDRDSASRWQARSGLAPSSRQAPQTALERVFGYFAWREDMSFPPLGQSVAYWATCFPADLVRYRGGAATTNAN